MHKSKSCIGYCHAMSMSINICEETYDIDFTAEITGEDNSGIGPYEYHGYKGYDKGIDSISEYDIHDLDVEWLYPDMSENTQYIIKDAILDKLYKDVKTKNYIIEQLEQHVSAREEDYD